MKKVVSCLRGLICLGILLMSGINARANHLVGMDFYYTWVSGNTYKITLIAYGDCGSGPGGAFGALPTNTPEVYVYNGGTLITTLHLAIEPPSTGVEITPVCPADITLTQCTDIAYTIPGIKKFVYSTDYTVTSPSAYWRFLFTGNLVGSFAGRALTITNIPSPPSSTIQLVDTLNNTVTHNSNPVLTNIPTPFFCLANPDNYNPGAVDPDGDSLSFFLVPGQDGTSTSAPGGLVSYVPPFTGANPLATSSFSFDPHTGQIAFNPSALQRSLVVYNIEEYHSGQLRGTSQREMTFLVQTCTNIPPTGVLSAATGGTIDDGTHFHICANSGAFSLTINPTEVDPLNNITVTTSGLPAGSSFTTVGNGTPTPHCTFTWTSTGVAPGSYTFYVTYTDNNCPLAGVQTLAYTVTILPLPTVSYSVLSLASCTRKEAISIVPGGAGTPWTIDVSSAGVTIQTFTGVVGAITDSLVAGSYVITIFSSPSLACSASVPVTVVLPPPQPITATFTDPSYCGNNDGTMTLHHLYPGVNTIKYTFNGVLHTVVVTVPADSTWTFTGLLAGDYTGISATYGFCVSATIDIVTLDNPAFTMRSITFVNPVYCGICTGSITLHGLHPGQTDTITNKRDGVAQPPVYHFIAADSTVTISGLCTGTYSNFVAKTAGVCISNTLGPVTLTAPFTQRAIGFTNPDFCGICNGTISIYGLHPGMFDTLYYTYGGVPQPPVALFVGGDSIIKITGLCAGTYDNFITHAAGVCVSNTLGPVTLVVPPFTMRAFSTVNPDFCGICNGSITLYGLHPGMTDTITYTYGGVPQPPVMHFIGPDSTVTITGLCAGVYDNLVAHTGGVCVSNTLGPVTLTVPPFTMRALSHTNPDYCGICNGTITLYGLHPGETDTITYTFGGVPQPPVIHFIAADSTVTLTGLCAGVYDNFIAHTGGVCVSNTLGPVTLTVPPFTMRSLSHTNPDFCGICNGTITLYGLHPGETDTISYTYDGVPQPPVIHLIGIDSTVTLTGLCNGTYDNFVARTGGVCVSNTLGPVDLTVPPFTMSRLSHTDPDYCGICNGTITLYGLHPGETDTISYTYNGVPQPSVVHLIGPDSTVTMTGLCNGLYNNFVARTGGICVSNTLGPVDLVVPPFTMRGLDHTNPEFCGICNGSITLYGLHPGETDSIHFTFNGVAQPPLVQLIGADSTVHLTGLCAGTYDNFVARTGGICISNTLGPVDLVVPAFTMSRLTYVNPTKCGFCDGVISLYGLHPGQTDTISYTINGVAQPELSFVIPPDSIIILTGQCEGIYDNFVARTGGVCVSNSLGPITLKAPPIIAGFDLFVHKNCKGDTVVFTNTSTPASDLTYTWYFGDGDSSTATNPSHIYHTPGVLNVKLIITNTKCFDSSIQPVTIDNLVTADFTNTPDSFICQGKRDTLTNLSAGTLLKYKWYFGDGYVDSVTNPVHLYKKSGVYDIVLAISNFVPCYDTARRTLSVDSISAISIAATDSVICGGSTITFDGIYAGIGNTGVEWTFGNNDVIKNENPVTYSYEGTGSFTVKLEAFYRACPDTSTTRNMTVFGAPTIYLGPDTSICPGSNAIKIGDYQNANDPHARWEWSNGETSNEITVVEPGYYYATVHVNGCVATDTVWVKNDCYMDIPNAFTPNGDGMNDYFFPRDLLARGLTTFRMEIYNRWGQMIFVTDNTEGRGWDGKFNDKPQPEGVFVYIIDATFKDGQKEHHVGNITLLR